MYFFLWSSNIPLSWYMPRLLDPVIYGGHSGWSHVLAIANAAARKGGVHMSFLDFFRSISRNEIVVSCGRSNLNILRDLHNVFHKTRKTQRTKTYEMKEKQCWEKYGYVYTDIKKMTWALAGVALLFRWSCYNRQVVGLIPVRVHVYTVGSYIGQGTYETSTNWCLYLSLSIPLPLYKAIKINIVE